MKRYVRFASCLLLLVTVASCNKDFVALPDTFFPEKQPAPSQANEARIGAPCGRASHRARIYSNRTAAEDLLTRYHASRLIEALHACATLFDDSQK